MKKQLFISILFLMSYNIYSQIEHYERFIGEYIDTENNTCYILLRKFTTQNNNHPQYLALNPKTLQTRRVHSKDITARDWNYLTLKYAKTPYIKMRNYAKKRTDKDFAQNAGITNVKNENHFIITTDLCPSTKPLEYNFYNTLNEKIKSNASQTIPVGIAVTGGWMNHHQKDLKWLLDMEKNKKLTITWINHSYNHKYIRGKEYRSNFLLIENTDIKKEIFDLEKIILEKNLPLSIYFRFPGLISNGRLRQKLLNFGLIPIGSDSWIAKNQFPKQGSIVLTHGNGNEHIGIVKFQKWLTKNNNKLEAISLNEAFINGFKRHIQK